VAAGCAGVDKVVVVGGVAGTAGAGERAEGSGVAVGTCRAGGSAALSAGVVAGRADRAAGVVVFSDAGTGLRGRNIDPVVGSHARGAGGDGVIAGEAGVAAGQRHAGRSHWGAFNVSVVALAGVLQVDGAGSGFAGGAGGGGGGSAGEAGH
jgi:hypothetical protein